MSSAVAMNRRISKESQGGGGLPPLQQQDARTARQGGAKGTKVVKEEAQNKE